MSRLGGWWRVWVVLTAIMFGTAATAALKEKDLSGDGKATSDCIPSTSVLSNRTTNQQIPNPKYSADALAREKVARRAKVAKEFGIPVEKVTALMLETAENLELGSEGTLKRFLTEQERRIELKPTINRSFNTPVFACSSWHRLGLNTLIALLSSLALLFGALGARWIIQGFRNQNAQTH